MNEYKRIFVIVLDSLGIGAMPDSPRFGDEGVDTFGHILEKMKTLDIPNLRKAWHAESPYCRSDGTCSGPVRAVPASRGGK